MNLPTNCHCPVRGALAMAYAVSKSAQMKGGRGFVLPQDSADEAALVGAVKIFAARDLLQVVAHLAADAGDDRGVTLPEHYAAVRLTRPAYPDFAEVKGQEADQAGARDRRRRRPQCADGRPARHRQDDAGAAPCQRVAADGH